MDHRSTWDFRTEQQNYFPINIHTGIIFKTNPQKADSDRPAFIRSGCNVLIKQIRGGADDQIEVNNRGYLQIQVHQEGDPQQREGCLHDRGIRVQHGNHERLYSVFILIAGSAQKYQEVHPEILGFAAKNVSLFV